MAAIGAFELATVELGMRLGLYQSLADDGPATAPQLAARTGIDARYAREWLEQQATAGIVAIDDDGRQGDPDTRVFSLPVEHQVCLVDPDSLACVAPLATFAVAGPGFVPALVERLPRAAPASRSPATARRSGGPRRRATARSSPTSSRRSGCRRCPTWSPACRPARRRVADIGCGCGWSSIAIARAFPTAVVHGYDSDEASVGDARANAEASGVADRVTFTPPTRADADGHYDLVCCFEALHDMAHPVEALSTMRRLAGDDGAVFVVDERAADALTASDPDPVQRFLYAASVLHCLPVGRSEEGSAATGTVLRTARLDEYAAAAGFSAVEVLPVDHAMFRLYRLR